MRDNVFGANPLNRNKDRGSTTLTGGQNNFELNGLYAITFEGSGDTTITGFASGAQQVTVINEQGAGNDLVLSDQDTLSSAANRIITGSGADITLENNQSAVLFRNIDDTAWLVETPDTEFPGALSDATPLPSVVAGSAGVSTDISRADHVHPDVTPVAYVVSTTGQTITPSVGTRIQVSNPAGTLAELTVNFPASPVDGQQFTLSITKDITTLTLAAPGGATINAGPTSWVAGDAFRWTYRATGTTWYRT